jgi:hypothetical protein
VQIVDCAERPTFKAEHLAQAINIPLAELGARATFELSRSELTAVDCTAQPDPRCSEALDELTELGFRTVALDAGQSPGLVSR